VVIEIVTGSGDLFAGPEAAKCSTFATAADNKRTYRGRQAAGGLVVVFHAQKFAMGS
jgi:hypothetical protein